MRAAVPHLRLLNFQLAQLNLVSRFLSSDQQRFIERFPSVHQSGALALGLNPNISRRNSLKLIPENLIETDNLQMVGKHLVWSSNLRKFCVEFQVCEGRSVNLSGVEILTQANNFAALKPNAQV